MCQLRPKERADGERNEGLDEEPRLELPVEDIADAAADRDWDNNHHRCPNRLQKRYAKDHHECDLDVRRRADAERTREHAAEKADGQPVEIEPPPRQEFLTHVDLPSEPFRLIDAQIEEERAGEQHHPRKEAQIRCLDVV